MKRVIACILILLLLLSSCAHTAVPDVQQDTPVPSGHTEPSVPAEEPDETSEENAGAETGAPENAPQPETPADRPEPDSGPDPGKAEAPEEKSDEAASEAEQEPETEPSSEDGDDRKEADGGGDETQPEEPAEEPAAPYSERTSSTVLTVSGSALDREWYFSLYDLQCLGGVISADYFSRGKEPQEMTTSYTGISVHHLLEDVIGLGSYRKVTFTASDGYAGSYSQGAVNMSYINEKDPSSVLWMILAWSEDGAPCALRLVMGQQLEGEYNRTYWVRDVVDIDVRA